MARKTTKRGKGTRRKTTKRWSGDVTSRSNALDLDRQVFYVEGSAANCSLAQTFRGTEQAAEGKPVPVGDVNAQLLHQPRRS